MPRTRAADGPAEESIAVAIAGLRREVRAVRSGQLKIMKTLVDIRHELNHRLSNSREEVGALVKASHAELAGQLGELHGKIDDTNQRVAQLEGDLDDIFEGRG